MKRRHPEGAPDGIVVVDKPTGWTSHDVVARVRKLAGTRRVGHAGTLDPMATGVLVIGVGRATRLLGYLSGHDKTYLATIRLGQTTTSDDADGDVVEARAVSLQRSDVEEAVARFVGAITQVPPAVSAVKVAGRRSYARARAGEDVSLAPRHVVVHRFAVRDVHAGPDSTLDVDAEVVCSAGTYIRALARDLGAALGVGAHLTSLRRNASGPYQVGDARSIEQLESQFSITPLADAVAAVFPRRDVDEEAARSLSYGVALPAAGQGEGPIGVFGPDGQVLALVSEQDGLARPLCVFSAGQ